MSQIPDSNPWHNAKLCLNGWAGYTEIPIQIIQETPKRYKVKILESAYRFHKNQIKLVPKYAVRLEETD